MTSAGNPVNQIAKWFAALYAARAAATRAPKVVTAFVAKQQELTTRSRRARIICSPDKAPYRNSYRLTKPKGKSAARAARLARRIARASAAGTIPKES